MPGWRARTPEGSGCEGEREPLIRRARRLTVSRNPGGDLAAFGRAPRGSRDIRAWATRVRVCARVHTGIHTGIHTCARGEGVSRRGLTARGVSLYVRRAWPGSANRALLLGLARRPLYVGGPEGPKSKASKNFSGRVKRHGERKGINALDLGLHFPSASRAPSAPTLATKTTFSRSQPFSGFASSISSLLDFRALHVLVRLLS